jgi:hypothetical protein
VKSDADDLDQISQAYRLKGYRIARRELQFWQLLAGGVSQTNHVVKTYAYYTPDGVSVRALTRWNDWSLAAEAVVHGRRTVELEVGRRMNLGYNIELFPKLLVSARGLGGSLKAEAHFGRTRLSMNVQLVNPATLLGSRANTSFDLQVTRLL